MINANTLFLVLLVAAYFAAMAYFERTHARRAFISNDEYLCSLALLRQCSVYDLFHLSGGDWRFSTSKIESDFQAYLRTGHIPSYVANYVKKHIASDEVRRLRRTNRLW